jgi:transcriptional regulator with XRE-family HTH domain
MPNSNVKFYRHPLDFCQLLSYTRQAYLNYDLALPACLLIETLLSMPERRVSPTAKPLVQLIGRRVRQARENAKLTQEELAARAAISRASLSEIENGHREQIKPAVLEAIAPFVDRQVRWFFNDDQEDTSTPPLLLPNLIPQTSIVLVKLAQLPPDEQKRAVRLLEHAMLWFESDYGARVAHSEAG